MSIFVNKDSKVIVQGITGGEGTKHTALVLKAAGLEPSIPAALARAHQALADGSAWARLEALRAALSGSEG